MKTISKVASALALVAISGTAFAATSGIASTKHNLAHNGGSSAGGAGGTGNNDTDATTEICVFCHTPHNANIGVQAPLWNRLASSATYDRYSALGTTTFDAAEAPVGSVSLACLSCHDGTQAMDAMLNGPGAGNDFVDQETRNALLTFTAGGLNANFTGNNATNLDGSSGWTETNQMSYMNGNIGTGDAIYLGTDLRNDHPISMQYGGGGIDSTAIAGTTTDLDYAQATGVVGTLPSAGTGVGGTGSVNSLTLPTGMRVWYVDTGTAGKQKNDFPLFTRSDNGVSEPFVECATCHDPHTTNSLFLRLPNGNSNSDVCLTCHTK